MNTHTNHDDLNKSFQDLFKPRSEEKEDKHDSLMLMAAFLSEIEYIQAEQNISRKQLAEKIKKSPSYLTQVFRNKKPLNFITLAKIKRVLNIRFEVRAFPKKIDASETNNPEYTPVFLYQFANESLSQTKDTVPAEGSKFIMPDSSVLANTSGGGYISTSTRNIEKIDTDLNIKS